jgi:protein gp37
VGSFSPIEWLRGGSTWNFLAGCSFASVGCQGCYALGMTRRLAGSLGGVYRDAIEDGRWSGRVLVREDKLREPERWRKGRLVFVNSMSDTFHPDVPEAVLDRAFDVMERASQHVYLLLTKRARRLAEYLGRRYPQGAPRHIRAGASVCTQDDADRQVPWLLQAPVADLFLSCEPLLGALNLRAFSLERGRTLDALTGRIAIRPAGGGVLPARGAPGPRISWVIGGGETSWQARPTHPDWARALRNQCQSAGVAFFWKAWGEWAPTSRMTALRPREDAGQVVRMPVSSAASPFGFLTVAVGEDAHDDAGEVDVLERLGKKRAGRELDGRTHDEMPEATWTR